MGHEQVQIYMLRASPLQVHPRTSAMKRIDSHLPHLRQSPQTEYSDGKGRRRRRAGDQVKRIRISLQMRH